MARFIEQAEHQDIEQRILVKKLDLASLKSVRTFAQGILESESRLDVLINNAGFGGNPERTLTEDGLEVTIASNHFGHFLLTNLLLPLLKSSAPSRVVVVSSVVHKLVKEFDPENLNFEKCYKSYSVYNESKLVNIYFTRQLAKRLEGTGVVVNALNPGFVDTDIFVNVPKWIMFLLKPVFFFFAKTPLQGAQTSVFLAASESPEALLNGRYFEQLKEAEISALAKNEDLAETVWKMSERITGLSSE